MKRGFICHEPETYVHALDTYIQLGPKCIYKRSNHIHMRCGFICHELETYLHELETYIHTYWDLNVYTRNPIIYTLDGISPVTNQRPIYTN